MNSVYSCCDSKRRENARSKGFNGIDYLEVIGNDRQRLEVIGDDISSPDDLQKLLKLHFINNLDIAGIADEIIPSSGLRPGRILHKTLDAPNFLITGGDRIREIDVLSVDSSGENALILRLSTPGDFSIYTLSLVDGSDPPKTPSGFDPALSSIDFSFKVECGSDLDCKKDLTCLPEAVSEPDINYLAKDYASFRETMLSRISALLPGWQERCPADLGVALVELLAYVADYLSYREDAIATEAYLGTARKRISLKRHARLVDYLMHDGCNSRVWVQIRTNEDCSLDSGTQILSRVQDLPCRLSPGSPEYNHALSLHPEIFETIGKADLFKDHNDLDFYTWGGEECCLPKGAIKAYLIDTKKGLNLQKGDVLILVEQSGFKKDPENSTHIVKCHPIRLTRVNKANDPLEKIPILEIEWHQDDSLPSPFCIHSGSEEKGEIWSKALGNIVLADNGCTIYNEPLMDSEGLSEVPPPGIFFPSQGSDRCQNPNPTPIYPRFFPKLKDRPLTFSVPYLNEDNHKESSAGSDMIFSPRDAEPSKMSLTSEIDGKMADWTFSRHLLKSHPESTHFVVEVEQDGSAYIRFGDGTYGTRPSPGTKFLATYRTGNGLQGNVGARSLCHIVTDTSSIFEVNNPLSAMGGVDSESMEEVRQSAPVAFKIQERAVTADDCAEIMERRKGIQKAAATIRWTGSWHTVFLTVDPVGGANVDDAFEKDLLNYMERYRMAGQDIEVDGPRFVPLEISITVNVLPDYFRSDVKKEIFQIISSRDLPGGRRGIFHPDNFTFGQSVYLSQLYSAIQSIPGVASVDVTKFQRLGMIAEGNNVPGVLDMGRLEIAILDRDPNRPDHGKIDLNMEGGR